MKKNSLIQLSLFLSLLLAQTSFATNYRAFWEPSYHGLPLSYCFDGKFCGRVVAKSFCQLMGYDGVKNYQKRHNVCTSRYLDSGKKCNNWACDGFRKIQCYASTIKHDAYYTQYAQEKSFYRPRFEKQRVNFCMKQQGSCGRAAANTFCRRMGYHSVQSYKKAPHIGLSLYIESKGLCLTKSCNGFEYIQCRRI